MVLIFHYDKVIPYSESLIKSETQDNRMLIFYYCEINCNFVSVTHPIKVKTRGEEKCTDLIILPIKL